LCAFSDHKEPIYALTFSPDGKYFTTGGADGWLFVYDVKVCFTLPFQTLLNVLPSRKRNDGRGEPQLALQASLKLTGSKQVTCPGSLSGCALD
jgi:WD40 repeat protein